VREPREVIPASRLSFAGIRGIYRRDGLGAVMNVPQPGAETHGHVNAGAGKQRGDDSNAYPNGGAPPRNALRSAPAARPFSDEYRSAGEDPSMCQTASSSCVKRTR
jgi:hypothetical protein